MNAQNCETPAPYEGNTGVNMTVMLLSTFVESLPVSGDSSYIVAKVESGMVVGSAEVNGTDQTSIAIWGNDTFTTQIDGATTGEEISFQLVDDSGLYDLEFMEITLNFAPTTSMTFVQMGIASVGAVSFGLNCSSSGGIVVNGCTDDSANNFNTEAVEDDGSCEYAVAGCTDTAACNYDAAATEDNTTCTFASVNYDCQGVCVNDTDADGVCDEEEIHGCTDATACNFDNTAT
ncbi:MAG: hypothetical protein P8I82_03285, partial [Flavobacteriales bacterium]|nr:hypothetical protein [Flavobacteriales bacterium]